MALNALTHKLPGDADSKRLRLFAMLEIVMIVSLALIPLFITFPYRVNIFLSWEGAYRMSQGQVPYRDFGMPLGYMFWVVPALFFKIFGAQLITLVKAQVFLNIISGLSFRYILKSFHVNGGVRIVAVLLYCLSYSFFNFWPWYNHTVIVYQMVALAFLMYFIFGKGSNLKWVALVLSALFVFASFFTKQDAGALTFGLCAVLLAAHCFYEKRWLPLLLFLAAVALIGAVFILPLKQYEFDYWFNLGQEPHSARLSVLEIIQEFFGESQWIKFYLFLIVLFAIASYRKDPAYFHNKRNALFLLLTIGILGEAAILQVTSYTPPDNNIFFHSFAIAFILTQFSQLLPLNFLNPKLLTVCAVGLLIWWSGTYWRYLDRVVGRLAPPAQAKVKNGENIINKKTFKTRVPTGEIPTSQWVLSDIRAFKKIYMPAQTVSGIKRVMAMDILKKKDPKVLNMTELTPLAVEIPYALETGSRQPLWYHLGVAIFNEQAATFEQKIARKEYDLVLFEYVPTLNNFYPFRVRDALLQGYQKTDSFPAPRRGDTPGMIEVFTR